MHMADALLAPSVAATMYVASGAVAGISVKVAEQLLLSQLQGPTAQEDYVERLLQQVEQEQA